MQIVLRLLCFLLSAPLLSAQDVEAGFVRLFGAPGSVGSFRARFSREGAGMVFLQATDHYVSLPAARREQHEPGDWLLLVENGRDHGLRLSLDEPHPAFPADPATAIWADRPVADGVGFALDGGHGLVLEKVLRHAPEQRGFVLELTLRNDDSDATGAVALQLGGPVLFHPAESSLFGDMAIAIAAPTTADVDVQSLRPSPGAVQTLSIDPRLLSFAGTTNRFFGAFLWPKDSAARDALVAVLVDTLPPRAGTSTTLRCRYRLQLQVPPRGAATTITCGMYLGPKSYRVFDTLDDPKRFAPVLDIDLNPPCCGIDMPGGRPMAKLLLWLLGIFRDLLGNWGVAIVLLTVLVRGALSPLNFRMQKSMRAFAAKMAKLKPKMDALKAKHADDPRAYQQALAEFNREHKIIPPLGGCLPILLTMPVYIGLFTALRTAYDLRQQPFVGWIDDLSRSDRLIELGFWPHSFNLLPLLWIGLYLAMTLRQPLPTDPQQRQMQQMMRYMPLVFGILLYNYASALLVYMVTSMLWGLVENAIFKKVLGPIDPNVGAMAPTPL